MTYKRIACAELEVEARFKRQNVTAHALDGGDVVPMRDACGSSAMSDSCVSSAEACAWLEKLSRSLHGGLSAQSSSMANLGERTWQCFAEMNLICAHSNFSNLPASAIRGLHSYTRMPREALLAAYMHNHGGASGFHSTEVQLVNFILSKVFSCYAEAAIARYTIEVPCWLLPWCVRWGLPPSRDGTISFQAVHAYTPQSQYWPSHADEPIRVVYVPCFSGQ